MTLKMTLTEYKKFEASKDRYFFSKDTMRFFASRLESWHTDGWFITSEKSGFEDYTRVYSVRRADFETAQVETHAEGLKHLYQAQEARKVLKAESKRKGSLDDLSDEKLQLLMNTIDPELDPDDLYETIRRILYERSLDRGAAEDRAFYDYSKG
jgi:hypothetical protein